MKKNNNSELFIYLLLFTGIFILAEISFFILCTKIYIVDFISSSHTFELPISILPGILFTISVQLFLHFIFTIAIWLLSLFVINSLKIFSSRPMTIAISLWSLGMISLLILNQIYFPNSRFSELIDIVLPAKNAGYVLSFLIILWSGIFCLSLYGLINLVLPKKRLMLATGLLFLCTVFFYLFHSKSFLIQNNIATAEKPNIIIVGIDSLRPDFVGYFGGAQQTPFLNSFLNQATVFAEATTPIARTFPSWISLLSGQYPRHNHIRTNLSIQDNLNANLLLTMILKRNGYETIYASDETRFSNINSQLGFDHIITPPIGLNDFIIGTFNDFPLSNVLVNFSIGKQLFPYNYGNRPVHFTYQPDRFLDLLKPYLAKKQSKPLFFAIHFCLPHFPYVWANVSANHLNLRERYALSIERVDKQVSDFYELLQNAHLLDHAIVVLLSDHGEALEFAGDRVTSRELYLGEGKPPQFYPPSIDHEEMNQSAGHGTDILSVSQYHTLLAFKLFGTKRQQSAHLSGVVSLLDIKPTLLQFLNIDATGMNGRSLVNSITSGINPQQGRHLFMETDFTPEAIRTIYPETRAVLLEGLQFFQVDPKSTRLTVKRPLEQMIIASKQYADLYNEWLLALYPQPKEAHLPILINLKTGQWTDDLHSQFAQQSPAQNMVKELKQFYGKEIEMFKP